MIFLSANNSSPVPSCTSKADELWCSCRLSAAETCWRRGADRHGEAMLEQTDSVSHLKTQVSMLEPKMLLIHFGLKTHHSVSKYRASSLSKHFVEQEHKSPTATLHIWRVCPKRRTFSSPTYIGNNLGLWACSRAHQHVDRRNQIQPPSFCSICLLRVPNFMAVQH